MPKLLDRAQGSLCSCRKSLVGENVGDARRKARMGEKSFDSLVSSHDGIGELDRASPVSRIDLS